MTNNFAILTKLAQRDAKDEYSSALDNPNLDEEIRAELEALRAKARSETAKAAAMAIVAISNNADAVISAQRETLANLRRQVAAVKESIQKIAVAKEYGNITSDYTILHQLLTHKTCELPVDKVKWAEAEKIIKDRFAEPMSTAKPASVKKSTTARSTVIKRA